MREAVRLKRIGGWDSFEGIENMMCSVLLWIQEICRSEEEDWVDV